MKAKREHTKYGMSTVYPRQKPEDVFTEEELIDWAVRKGWKLITVVEIFDKNGKGKNQPPDLTAGEFNRGE